MGIVAKIRFGSKEEKSVSYLTLLKTIILWIVRILYSLKYFLVCPGIIPSL